MFGLTRFAAQDRDKLMHPDRGAILAHVAVFNLEIRHLLLVQAPDLGEVLRAVIGVQELAECRRPQFLLRVSEQSAVSRIALLKSAVQIGDGDAGRGVFKDLAQPLFALAQSLLSFPPLRDIPALRHDEHDLALRIANRNQRDVEGLGFARGSMDARFQKDFTAHPPPV